MPVLCGIDAVLVAICVQLLCAKHSDLFWSLPILQALGLADDAGFWDKLVSCVH